MTFQDENEVFEYIKSHQRVDTLFIKAREYKKELLSLIDGEGFIEELIKRIEFVETEGRVKARKKYSRSIADMNERLFQPIGNVFHSTGGSFNINIDNDNDKKDFLKKLSNVRDEKSLKQYVESDWMPLFHIDPNGLIFTEYDTIEEKPNVYPTYKSIDSIRHYISNGQLLDVLLFEPKPLKDASAKSWRVIDDVMDYTVIQTGNNYHIDEDKTFEHPFGQVPGLINSNIIDISSDLRLSPIHKIIGIMKEFATNQSVKSIYKMVQGNPIHWRVGSQCQTCRGRKKLTDSSTGKSVGCTDCGGSGTYESKDVTDLTIVPYPREGEVSVLPNIAGYVSPDLETWKQLTEELIYLENLAYTTLWGITQSPEKSETATGRFIDQQPMLNRLNKYTDVSEWVNWKLAEWIGDVIVKSQPKEDTLTSIQYGRRFILESADSLLNKYEESKKEQDNSVILDRLLNEYITSKYSNDTEQLRIQLIKASTEPYVHLTINVVDEIFGKIEAKRKVLFAEYFNSLEHSTITEKSVSEGYNKWFEDEISGDVNELLKTLSGLSPLLANKLLEKLNEEEIRNILNLKSKSNNNE